MVTLECEPYEPNTNVFLNDCSNMGICVGVSDETKGQVVGNRIMIMTSNHTSKSCLYVRVVNEATGEVVKVFP